MRFLSPSECREFVAALALDPEALGDERKPRLPALKHARLFVLPDVVATARPVAGRLVAFLGVVDQSLLWAHGLVFGDGSGDDPPRADWRPYVAWRRAAGELRTLADAPGHLFAGEEQAALADAAAFAIRLGWEAALVTRPRPVRTVIHFSHNDHVGVQARRNLTGLAADLTRLGLHAAAFW